MQYKNRKFYNYFVLLGLVVLFFLGIFRVHVSAQVARKEATTCPAGWNQNLNNCCPQGTRDGVNAEDPCFKTSDNSPADRIRVSIVSEFFCPDGEIRINEVGQNWCYSRGSTIDGDLFIGCITTSSPSIGDKRSPQVVAKTGGSVAILTSGSPSSQITFPFCIDKASGIFVKDRTKCLCANGNEVSPSGSTCEKLCGTGNVLYDPAESGFANICNGPECCGDDATCTACVGTVGNETGNIYTALGCVNPTRNGIVVWLIRISLILTTAIGVFRFIQASFLIRTGDPEKIKEGQEIITSAIIALVLVLVSVPLLQFIGVNVLGIFPEGFI